MPYRANAWDDTMIVKVYELAKQGLKGESLAKALGIHMRTLKKWKKERAGFRYAIERARAKADPDKDVESFKDYVLGRLPPDVQELWHKMHAWEEEKNGLKKIEALLRGKGDYIRMQLFLYALIQKNFVITAACRILGISVDVFEHWCTNYPEFQRMLGYVKQYKKDFFEDALMDLVRERDTSAVIFVNKTMNRDRGYNDKVDINVSGNIGQTHLIDISILDLPIEVKKQILDAWRKHKNADREPEALEYRRVGDKAVPIVTESQETESEAA